MTKNAMATYKNSGFFALRAPLLPLEAFTSLSSGLTDKRSLPASQLEEAIRQDRKSVRSRMADLLLRPEVREALLLASPSLEENLQDWETNPDSEAGLKVEAPLMRYLTRMASRCTPFGLFAGSATGSLTKVTQLRLAPTQRCGRFTRLDNDYLFLLLEDLNKDPKFRSVARYWPNTSLYRDADRLRYVEAVTNRETRAKTYQLVSVDRSEFLELVLEAARHGALLSELAELIVRTDAEVSEQEARDYVEMLVDNQILVSELSVAVTGKEPLDDAIAVLDRVHPGEVLEQLIVLRDSLARLDCAGLGRSRRQYEEILELVERLPVKDVKLSRLFQVNLTHELQLSSIGSDVLGKVRRAVDALYRITPSPSEPYLKEFRDKLAQRYEGRTVPLLEVLDEERGIGVEAKSIASEVSPLLEGLFFFGVGGTSKVVWGKRETALLAMLEKAQREGWHELNLDERDVELMEVEDKPPLPSSFFAMVQLADEGEGKTDVYFQNASGPSGVKMLGRFCHENPRLAQLCRLHLEQEEELEPDAVFAEIVHLPDGRIGNVVCRPVLREYEIPFLGKGGVDREHRIELEDLLVSLEGGKITLRSKRLGKRVVPRMTNMHNIYQGALGPYKLLGQLQYEGVLSGLSWSWGALSSAPHLPRVRLLGVIVSKEQWTLDKRDLESWSKATGAARFEVAQRLRETHRMPRFIALEDADNVLTVDLENIVSIDSVVEVLRNRSSATFIEVWPHPDGPAVAGDAGHYANEVVIPYVADKAKRPVASPVPSVTPYTGETLTRRFAPGSEWLFIKLYTGSSLVDRLLRDFLAEPLFALTQEGTIDRWFFIRYGDPEWHLRLRVHGDPRLLMSRAWPRLSQCVHELLDTGLVSTMVLDTYEREVERYGGPFGMESCEALFYADSVAAVRLLDEVLRNAGEEGRWRCVVMGIDRLLDSFGYDLAAKSSLLSRLRSSFAKEFSAGPALEGQLARKYRDKRLEVEALLDARNEVTELGSIHEIWTARGVAMAPHVTALLQAMTAGRVTLRRDDLLASLIHMHTNRLFRAAGRAQELVVYDFLSRTYRSMHARADIKK